MTNARRVLIVDDDDDLRELVGELLEQNGYDVVAVESGADALAYLANDRPAVVLLDLEMSDISGWEVIGYLDGDPRFRDVRIVVLSGREPAQAPRAAAFLRKPVGADELLRALAA